MKININGREISLPFQELLFSMGNNTLPIQKPMPQQSKNIFEKRLDIYDAIDKINERLYKIECFLSKKQVKPTSKKRVLKKTKVVKKK